MVALWTLDYIGELVQKQGYQLSDYSESCHGYNSENNYGYGEKGMEIEWTWFADGVRVGCIEKDVSTGKMVVPGTEMRKTGARNGLEKNQEVCFSCS